MGATRRRGAIRKAGGRCRSIAARQPEAFRRYRDAYQRRHFDVVLADGHRLAATLEEHPAQRRFVAPVALMFGAALAESDAFTDACTWLEHGLDRAAADEDAEVSIGRGDKAGLDWFALRLVELQILLGRYGEAWNRLTPLEEPTKPDATRLAAIRGRAALNTIKGEYELAHNLLNAAATVTERLGSRFLEAEVDADRAIVLATQGRLREAGLLAERTLEGLIKTPSGPHGAWAAGTTAAVALTIARRSFGAGLDEDGERWLLLGAGAIERSATTYLTAQLDVTIATSWRHQGSIGRAEELCTDAAVRLAALGCRPAEASATLELAELALAHGMAEAALPLAQRALDELSYLGHARDRREAADLVRRLTSETPGALFGPARAGGRGRRRPI